MNKQIVILLPTILYSFCMLGQIDTLNRNMISMSETIEKPYKVGSVYFKKGATKPYTGILYGKFENGNYLTIQEYVDGIGNGKWVNYYSDGTLKEIGTYRDNLVEGPIRQFHPNGKLKAKGNYKHWKRKVGTWEYFDTDGQLTETVVY